jgi:YidC/Oxa1 family membrane protein insertase
MKEQQKIQPEMKKIQEKYKNKKDESSQRKQQEELSALYKKHGVNPLGGCLPLLIQMPILFALFRVLRNIPAYITQVKDVYAGIIAQVVQVDGYETVLDTYLENKTVSDYDVADTNKIIDLLSQLTNSEWVDFKSKFASVSDMIAPLIDKLYDINNFLTINLTDKPVSSFQDIISIGTLIPLLCFISQIIIAKTTMAKNTSSSSNPAQDQTQKTMMYMMPLITVFFVITMPAGLGLYWLVSNMVQLLQQFIFNKLIHDDNDKGKIKTS